MSLLGVPALVSAQTVVVDPGHGGHDPGAVGCGLEEEDVVLDTSQRVARMLTASGITPALTRDDDRFIELSARSSFSDSRGAERFVSIHSNSNAGTPATGIETFHYSSGSAASRTLATYVQEEMVSAWGLRNRGVKTGNFSVLRRTAAPAALTELGFTNNCGTDATYLASPERREEAAAAIYRGIMRSLGRTPGDVTPPTEPPPTGTAGRVLGVVFQDNGAGLEDTSQRVLGSTVTLVGTAHTMMVDAEGFFQFSLPAGTYMVQASAPGWQPATRTCTLTTGDEWCSVGLTTRTGEPTAPPTEPTTPGADTLNPVNGQVWVDDGTMSTMIPGVSIRVVGRAELTQTDPTGMFHLELPAGIHMLEYSAAGYVTASRFCEVSDGMPATCSFGLAQGTGVAPPPTSPTEPTAPSMPLPMGSVGRLQGVIWVDDNQTIRVSGMTVRLQGFDPITTTNNSGFWYFDIPAGTYTVEAMGPGYTMAARTCEVRPEMVTSCSFGVYTLPPAPGETGEDRLDTFIDERPEEAAAAEAPPPSFGLGASGCSAGGRGTAGWLLLLVGLLFVRRRRFQLPQLPRVALLAAFALVVACDGDPEEAAHAAAVAEGEAVDVQVSAEVQLVDQVHVFARLENERILANGDFIDVSLAPDGAHLALSHAGYNGLSVIDVASSQLSTLVEAPRTGYAPVWRADGQALGIRVRGQSATAVPIEARDLAGQRVAPIVTNRQVRVQETEDDKILVRFAGGGEMIVSPPGDRYYAPIVSSDGQFVAFHGLSTGCYLFRVADGSTFHLGKGTHSRFDPDSRWLVFERLHDDGHDLTEGDIYITDLQSQSLSTARVESEIDAIEQSPSIVGNRLAFIRNGTVIIADLITE